MESSTQPNTIRKKSVSGSYDLVRKGGKASKPPVDDLIDLNREIGPSDRFGEIIGRSSVMKYVYYRVQKVASTDSTVLLLGETGTGKELIARAIHNHSLRRSRRMVAVNCAALPADLVESELFGHERGAFTGATQQKTGRFEMADGGTLFLDEVGELPVNLQAKLLRALESGTFERVGGRKTIQVDVRIIAATNCDLEEYVRNKVFRKDLYYRLNVFPITIPPLRRRPEDVPILVGHFVRRFNQKLKRNISFISADNLKQLKQHPWDGNVRELVNLLERTVIMSSGDVLEVDLPACSLEPDTGFQTLEQIEREYILKVLEHTSGKVHGADGAAAILGLNPSTLRSRMRKLGIRKSVVVK